MSLLQASQKLWAPKLATADPGPAPPAESSLDQVLGPEEQVDLEEAVNCSVVEDIENVTNLTETGDVFMVNPSRELSPCQWTHPQRGACVIASWEIGVPGVSA